MKKALLLIPFLVFCAYSACAQSAHTPNSSLQQSEHNMTLYLQGQTAVANSQVLANEFETISSKIHSVSSNADGTLLFFNVSASAVPHMQEYVKTKNLNASWISFENGAYYLTNSVTLERTKLKQEELQLISSDL